MSQVIKTFNKRHWDYTNGNGRKLLPDPPEWSAARTATKRPRRSRSPRKKKKVRDRTPTASPSKPAAAQKMMWDPLALTFVPCTHGSVAPGSAESNSKKKQEHAVPARKKGRKRQRSTTVSTGPRHKKKVSSRKGGHARNKANVGKNRSPNRRSSPGKDRRSLPGKDRRSSPGKRAITQPRRKRRTR